MTRQDIKRMIQGLALHSNKKSKWHLQTNTVVKAIQTHKETRERARNTVSLNQGRNTTHGDEKRIVRTWTRQATRDGRRTTAAGRHWHGLIQRAGSIAFQQQNRNCAQTKNNVL